MYTKSHNVLTFLKNVDASQIYAFKQHLNSLISVTKAIDSISRLDELLEKIMHYALTVTGAERGFLFLYSQNNENLKLEVMRGVNEKKQEGVFSFETYRISREIINVVENTGRAVIGSQEDSSIADEYSDLKHYGIKQALCVPFRVREKTLGFLYLDHTFNREMFRIEELELMKSFAILTSLSIENAYLTRKIEKRKLNNISVTMTTIPTMPDLKIITIKGILDFITMKHADEKITPLIEHGTRDIIIDLSKIDYANKSGIFCLLKYMVLITSKKRTLKLVKPPHQVYKTMEIVGLLKRFVIYDSIGEAVSTFS